MRNRLKFRSDPSDYSLLSGSDDDLARRNFPQVVPPVSVSNLSVSQLAKSFPDGGGAPSTDLALDLALNQIAEQARLATACTGVAIALTRSGDLVCRATTGSAPDLGMRLNPYAGLSGLSLQTRKPQHSDDADADSRVDAIACRALRVRSILVVPILKQGEAIGLIEAFSADPFHFREHDIDTLNSFCRQIGNHLDQAPRLSPVSHAPAVTHREEDGAAIPESAKLKSDSPSSKVDGWTLLLTASVIAAALCLGWLLGRAEKYRASAMRSVRPASHSSPKNTEVSTKADFSQPIAVPANSEATVNKNAEVKSKYDASKQENNVSPSNEKKASADQAVSTGLVVSQNGKVVFRESDRLPPTVPRVAPQNTSSGGVIPASRTELLTPEAANQYLSYRVEPHYPEAARQQHIRGPVVLKVMVAKDGSVQQVQVLSGDRILSAAAASAVVQWKFKPLSRVGQPVEFETQVTVDFKLP